MIKLGEINFDDEKGRINLELNSLVENNFTQHESNEVQILWDKLATLIESALSKVE